MKFADEVIEQLSEDTDLQRAADRLLGQQNYLQSDVVFEQTSMSINMLVRMRELKSGGF